MHRSTVCLLLFVLATPVQAQERGTPKIARPEQYGLTAEEIARHTAALPPRIEGAAHNAQAKMDALERRMDKRVRQATSSVCAGCDARAAARSQAGPRRASARVNQEPAFDPAEAPPLD